MLVTSPSFAQPNACDPPRLHPSTFGFPRHLAQNAISKFIELAMVFLHLNMFISRLSVVTNHALIQDINCMLNNPIHPSTFDFDLLPGVLLVPELDGSHLFLNTSDGALGIAVCARVSGSRILDCSLCITSGSSNLAH